MNEYETVKWLEKWRIKADTLKSSHVTFILRKNKCPPVTLKNHPFPHADLVKYLGMQLTWMDELN